MAQTAPVLDRPTVQETEEPAIPGVVRLSERNIKLQKTAVLFLTLAPAAGLVAAIVTLWGSGLSGLDVGLMVGMYLMTAFGVTIGYHRLLTHQSFDTPKAVRVGFAVAGSLAIQGSVISWVADHRRHHAFSDKPGDPHSPHVDDDSFSGIVRGLWHAHVGWLTDEERTVRERWAPDMLKDPAMVKVDRLFPWLATISLVFPAVVGLAVTGTLGGAIRAFLWAGLVRMLVLHHVTWSINSICHFFGYRSFETTDMSTNNWPLAILSLGESWHNNHHAFPSSAVHGIKRRQIDLSAAFIVTLEKLHLASNVRRPTEKQLSAKAL
jgi:stearoyl-CoA desaturase (Delta-9 desaturase)